MNTDLIQKYASVLRSDATPVARDPRLLMTSQDGVSIYYAPFEFINQAAKVVLVGITPGPTQMINANQVARRELLAGSSHLEATRKAKEEGAFSGEPMRSNLIRQLDHWGVHRWLGIASTQALFTSAKHLVQTTSLLRYPVFVNGDDYRGTPDMTRHPLLRQYLLEHFVQEVRDMPQAIFIPLGPQVQKVLDLLVIQGVLQQDQIVRGMLHPSGNNTYRINYLTSSDRGPVPHATNPAPYDEGREVFRKTYL